MNGKFVGNLFINDDILSFQARCLSVCLLRFQDWIEQFNLKRVSAILTDWAWTLEVLVEKKINFTQHCTLSGYSLWWWCHLTSWAIDLQKQIKLVHVFSRAPKQPKWHKQKLEMDQENESNLVRFACYRRSEQ